MAISGIDDMSMADLGQAIEEGGRFVVYSWTISIVVMTFKNPTDVFFIKGSQSRFTKGLPYTLASMVVGWWGIPWGPIYTLGSIFGNIKGKDVTREMISAMNADMKAQSAKTRARQAVLSGKSA